MSLPVSLLVYVYLSILKAEWRGICDGALTVDVHCSAQVRHCCCLSGVKRGINEFTFDSTGTPSDAYGGARIRTVKTVVQ